MKNARDIIAGLGLLILAFTIVVAFPPVFNSPVVQAGPSKPPTPISTCGTYDAGNYVLANDIDGVPQNQVCIMFYGKATSHSATTFDMGGHHIYCSTPGTGLNGVSLQGYSAVEAIGSGAGPKEGITIQNGIVAWCQVGIRLLGTGWDTLTGMELVDNGFALDVESPNDTVTNNWVHSNNWGVFLFNYLAAFQNNRVQYNCGGVYIDSGGYPTYDKKGNVIGYVYQQILNNDASNNGPYAQNDWAFFCGGSGNGYGFLVPVEDPTQPLVTAYNSIQGNTAIGNDGVDAEDDHANCTSNNWGTVTPNTFGIKNPPCIN